MGERLVHVCGLVVLVLVLGAGSLPMSSAFGAAAPIPPDAACRQSLFPGSASDAAAPQFAPDELLVRFRPGVGHGRSEEILAAEGAASLRAVPKLDVRVVRVPPGLTVERAIERLSRMPEVEYAEPNYTLHALQSSDPGLSHQWAPQKIGAPAAWGITSGSPAVIIAVVDTGIDYRHPQLAPNIWSNSGEVPGNGVDDDHNGLKDDIRGWDYANNDADPLDDHMHGTHVSGIAAAILDDDPEGMAGVCPSCTLMPVKVLAADGSGSLDKAASGIIYAADNGARVINLSLGAPSGTTTLENAINYAWDHGVLVVAAAGNDAAEKMLYPAGYPNTMAVASTGDADLHSCYSNTGYGYVAVAAPGEKIYSTTLVDAEGKPTYAAYSGTSMASPHVSGLAGLLFSRSLLENKNWTNSYVRSLIEGGAIDLGPLGVDGGYGKGRIDAWRSINEDTSPARVAPTAPGSGSQDASAFAHARKLARDRFGVLHLVWHSRSGDGYEVLYANSTDNGTTWSAAEVLFQSFAETYHPAMTVDDEKVYVAFPSRAGSNGTGTYQTFFSARPLGGGSWSTPVPLLGGAVDAVRPDIFLDPTNGRLHLVAASLDNSPDVYYTASGDRGATWTAPRSVNVTTSATASMSRYAAVHAFGNQVWIAAKTVAPTPFTTNYYLHTVRSVDGGASWFDQYHVSTWTGFVSREYGLSLAGVGDRVYMGYEVGGTIWFRRWLGAAWSDYEPVYEGTAGNTAWPTITQAPDGQAWMIWQDYDSTEKLFYLRLRHYTGSTWDPVETIHTGNLGGKQSYPNLKLGTSGDLVEWVTSNCRGAPIEVKYSSRSIDAQPPATRHSDSHARSHADAHSNPDQYAGANCDAHSDADEHPTATATATSSPVPNTSPGAVRGTVWLDGNGDGVVDSGEPRLANVTVTLSAGGVQTVTLSTFAGAYEFRDLPPGSYTVEEVQPLAMRFSSTLDRVTVSVAAGQEQIVDFGDWSGVFLWLPMLPRN